MNIGSSKNFAIIAKLSSRWLLGFRDPSVAQLIYKKGEGGAIHLHSYLPPPPPPPRVSLAVSSPVPEPKSPALSPFVVPCLHSSCLARVALVLSPISARAYYSHAQPSPGLALHRHHLSTTVRAACLRVHCPSLRHRFSPLQCRGCLCRRLSPLPSPAKPWSSLCVCVAYCLHSRARACSAPAVFLDRRHGPYSRWLPL